MKANKARKVNSVQVSVVTLLSQRPLTNEMIDALEIDWSINHSEALNSSVLEMEREAHINSWMADFEKLSPEERISREYSYFLARRPSTVRRVRRAGLFEKKITDPLDFLFLPEIDFRDDWYYPVWDYDDLYDFDDTPVIGDREENDIDRFLSRDDVFDDMGIFDDYEYGDRFTDEEEFMRQQRLTGLKYVELRSVIRDYSFR